MSIHFAVILCSADLATKVDMEEEVLEHFQTVFGLRDLLAEDSQHMLTTDLKVTPVEATVVVPAQSAVVGPTFQYSVEVREPEVQILVLFRKEHRLAEPS